MTDIPENVMKAIKDAPGVELHGNNLRISFYYRGVRCKPRIDVLKINMNAVNHAVLVRKAVQDQIKSGDFDYAKTFPNCPKAKRFSKSRSVESNRTVEEGVDQWLAVCKVKKAPATYRGYKGKAEHVKNRWPGQHRIKDVTQTEIESFQAFLLESGLAAKTVNDIFTVVRAVWAAAFADSVVDVDPLQRISNFTIEAEDEDDEEVVMPFSRSEMQRIGETTTYGRRKERESEKNAILFNCWTGLSLSELMGLAWEDIDLVNWTLNVRRAYVRYEYKVPKERSRRRTVEILTPAREWLLKQRELTYMKEPIKVTVRQRDNHNKRDRELRFVFLNTVTGEPLGPSSFLKWFGEHLRKAKIPHRGANQCRHTYASQLLTSRVDLEYLRQMLGHTDYTMIRKHYGRWIKEDTPNRADLVSQQLGFETEEKKLKVIK